MTFELLCDCLLGALGVACVVVAFRALAEAFEALVDWTVRR